MIELVEEFKNINTVYMLVDTTKDFIYGEYKVSHVEFKGINSYSAKITLLNAPKKIRYFRESFDFEGFRFSIKHPTRTYIIYDSYDEMAKDFCKKLNASQQDNPKLVKKLKKQYPSYFKETYS